MRELYIYDDCNNLIQKILDDGEDAYEQRMVANYILRQEAPFLHMPEWIEEKYFEQETIKLLTKKHLFYDPFGNVAQEDVYDADGKFVYSIFKTFNERGDLLSETNPLGQKATYLYDERGMCRSL